MKRFRTFTLCLCICMLTLALGCQYTPEMSVPVSSEAKTAHSLFESTDELIEFLKTCVNSPSYFQGVWIGNLIEDGIVTLYEPTFTPPEGFYLFSIYMSGYDCSYDYWSYSTWDPHDQKVSSSQTTALPSSESEIAPTDSSHIECDITKSLTIKYAQSKKYEENTILLQWNTQKQDDPISYVIEQNSLIPYGNDETPRYYYEAYGFNGEIWSYGIYWNTDGYLFYAKIPAFLFNEATITEICSFTPVTAPCYN